MSAEMRFCRDCKWAHVPTQEELAKCIWPERQWLCTHMLSRKYNCVTGEFILTCCKDMREDKRNIAMTPISLCGLNAKLWSPK
jgi:hypothetical protein